ncbi:MAG: sensor histidine kinase [Chloroflexi bacterium]|nr:sensor histidine kinase [Chloroflexota bacterium]
MDRKKFRLIKWLITFVPALSVGLYETLRHSLFDIGGFFGEFALSQMGNLITAGLVLVFSLIFGQIVFGWMEQAQVRLASQNRTLRALNRRLEHSAVLEERQRLSREMHDGIAQLLAYVMVKTDTIEGLLQAGRTEEARRELEEMRQSCNKAYVDVREDISGLRTDLLLLEDGGLATVLREALERFGDEQGCEVTFSCEGFQNTTIEPATEVQLVRVAQEALSNVRKHASANQVSLVLGLEPATKEAEQPSLLRMELRDDGCGFNPTQPFPDHFGLTSMRERVESLGGQLEIESRPGSGTLIRVTVPSKLLFNQYEEESKR